GRVAERPPPQPTGHQAGAGGAGAGGGRGSKGKAAPRQRRPRLGAARTASGTGRPPGPPGGGRAPAPPLVAAAMSTHGTNSTQRSSRPAFFHARVLVSRQGRLVLSHVR